MLFATEMGLGIVDKLVQGLALEFVPGVVLVRRLKLVQQAQQPLVVIVHRLNTHAVGFLPFQLSPLRHPVVDHRNQYQHTDQNPGDRIGRAKQESESDGNDDQPDTQRQQ